MNGRNRECNFYNMRLFLSEYIFEIILSNEKIFDMYSSVDHLGLNASTVEIKVKLCILRWVVYTQKSFVPEI